MGKSIFLIFSIFGIVSAWAEKALEDGKITIVEAIDLAVELAGLLGIRTEIDMDGLLPRAENNAEPEDVDLITTAARGPPAEEEEEDLEDPNIRKLKATGPPM